MASKETPLFWSLEGSARAAESLGSGRWGRSGGTGESEHRPEGVEGMRAGERQSRVSAGLALRAVAVFAALRRTTDCFVLLTLFSEKGPVPRRLSPEAFLCELCSAEEGPMQPFTDLVC
jgi:hypothetical protein